ncbi:LacI family transcriptional regulator [Salibacterium salarium]|uniref:LacI family transcriptional regulator n=1 Tax=Salibacterium salarium TaxID=284579 RepID=A0A3R9QM62_9BACI|nr:LacI family DNA-binding transcriptional regulator [Salibacterium salarium]RSL33904.1 LacI family transcriptional regulator [Salibacterium salarium]
MASIKEVAQKANVSTATVSHVINETRYVSDTTKDKVFAAMNELEYRPNMVARSLRSRKSNTIGLLVPLVADDTSNFFFMSIANGIEQVLKDNGYNLILSNSNEDLHTEREQIEVFNTQFIDGLVIAPVDGKDVEYEEAFSGDYPVVYIDRRPQQVNGDTVLVDNKKASFEAVSSLLEKGHYRVGFITGTLGITTSEERQSGYQEALEAFDIPPDVSFIKEGPATFQSGYDLAEELYKQNVTALFIANNVMTMGAMSFLQEIKANIPDDIAIIGYDDYDWMKVVSPPLSVVKQPSFELGKKAVEQLVKRIEGSDSDASEILLEAEFIERGSS